MKDLHIIGLGPDRPSQYRYVLGTVEPHPTDEVVLSLEDKIEEAHQILRDCFAEHEPIEVWGCFSGGYDSLVATHVAASSGLMTAAIHLNTGIGIEQTRQFVRDTSEKFDWKLLEYRADEYIRGDGTPDPQIYEELVKERGFPGPPHHKKMFNRLKERPLNQAVREHKTDKYDRIMLVTGVRRDESQRRMGIEKPVDRAGAKVWVNPLLNWTKLDCRKYMELHDLPINEVVELICMSGECLCGAFAHEGELAEIELLFPDVAERIKKLERDCEFPWGWEGRPPEWWLRYQDGQNFLPGVEPEQLSESEIDEMMLCHDCKSRGHKRNFSPKINNGEP